MINNRHDGVNFPTEDDAGIKNLLIELEEECKNNLQGKNTRNKVRIKT
jgi:hypothetical protein